MSRFPSSVPLHPYANAQLHRISCKDLESVYQNAKRHLLETFKQLIDSPSTENVEHHVEELISSYEEIRKAQKASIYLSSSLKLLNQEYIRESEGYDPVTIDNWEAYRKGELERPPKLTELFDTIYNREETVQVSEDDKILKSLPFIWRDPTCVIPDQAVSTNEDDLQIEGGKIELICPITYKPFENPMISKKCNHVFDKAGLANYFNEFESRDCPQGGCSQKLTLSDFTPDPIMELRCRIANFKKSCSAASNQEAELDVI